MKKNLVYPLLIILFFMTACNANKSMDISEFEKSDYDSLQLNNQDIELSVKEKSISTSTKQITLIFKNLSNNEYTFDERPHLEINIDDVWYVLPVKENATWNDLASILPSKGTVDDDFHLEDYYDTLNIGKYRIIKELYSDNEKTVVAVEFEIQ